MEAATGRRVHHVECMIRGGQVCRFKLGEGRRGDDPTAGIDSPRPGRPLPKILSEAEVGALLNKAHEGGGPEALRRAALVELLSASGLRLSELVGLRLRSDALRVGRGCVRTCRARWSPHR